MYDELLKMDADVLNAKYEKLFGEAPHADYNKQQIASAISKADIGQEDDEEAEAEVLKAQASKDLQIKSQEKILKATPQTGNVSLERRDASGNVIDTLSLKRATWNNLPAAKKVGLHIVDPIELKAKKVVAEKKVVVKPPAEKKIVVKKPRKGKKEVVK